ncbi:MAG: arginine--tRNA ligase [Clostridia bacterium]|nr:arginine--tRNA ligase [Clostridia bacterium]
MNKFLQDLTTLIKTAFLNAGFDEEVVVSDCAIAELGDFQCQTALALAKKYRMSPLMIAQKVVENFTENKLIKSISAVNPGYINFFVTDEALSQEFKAELENLDKPLGVDNRITVVDYGGANVAKPLHVGHLRSANIGESIKRICTYAGNKTIGDVHLGDWGLQMGMIIAQLQAQHPDWIYFDENFTGEYPQESPITVKDLETLYPQASQKAKADEEFKKKAQDAMVELQNGRRGYYALWKHFLEVSKKDLKTHYDALNVNFELWLGESDSVKYYPALIEEIIAKGYAKESQGATIVEVEEEADVNPVPPFMLKKSDGGVTYATTDLATIVQRDKELGAERMVYVVDKRQDLHFKQVFRCTKKTGVTSKDIQLDFAGFGTMNGKDGKPYKTRDGGVMQLGVLIADVIKKAEEKVEEAKGQNADYSLEEKKEISTAVAISALKFADLSIFRMKDYIFDPDKFCSFEGKTGPYLLYTITRAKSILKKSGQNSFENFEISHMPRQLVLTLLAFKSEAEKAYQELAPSVLCDYVYKLANLFNTFYNSCNIISEEDQAKKSSWLYLTNAVVKFMEKVLDLLAIKTLEKM